MWIRTQNKQRIINSDQIIDIFVDRRGTKIMAETASGGDIFVIGEYEDRETSLKVLETLALCIGTPTLPGIDMYLGNGADGDMWIKVYTQIAESHQAYNFMK